MATGVYHEYPTSYNGTNVSSASDFFVGYPAYITDALSVGLLPILFFASIMAVLIPFGTLAAFTMASYISTILSVWLWGAGYLNFTYVMVFLVMMVIGTVASLNSKSGQL